MSCDEDPLVIRVEKLLDEGYAFHSRTDHGQFVVTLYAPRKGSFTGWGNCFEEAFKAADRSRVIAGQVNGA